MANIKIAQLTNKTTLADTDLVIVESATQTQKMTVANLKNLLGINGKVNQSDYDKGKIEYLYIAEGVQTAFPIDTQTTYQFVLSANADGQTTIINVTRFTSTGLVYSTIFNGTNITIQTNAGRTTVFLTPQFAVRGYVIKTKV